jgi:hypothetical protein
VISRSMRQEKGINDVLMKRLRLGGLSRIVVGRWTLDVGRGFEVCRVYGILSNLGFVGGPVGEIT